MFDKIIEDLHEKEAAELKELNAYQTSRQEMATSSDMKLKAMLPVIEEKIKESEHRLQKLKERRVTIKGGLDGVNIFNDEGLYTCVIKNVRGGNIIITKITRPAVVFVEHSERFRVKVRPQYFPRAQVIRKKWTIYSSILGTFTKGKLNGLVLIRYNDGSFYEGPYISEEWLDSMGRVNELGRAGNHYGIFRTVDGRTFEGKMVDNHFDPNNLQSFYRLTLPNGEIYEVGTLIFMQNVVMENVGNIL